MSDEQKAYREYKIAMMGTLIIAMIVSLFFGYVLTH